MWSRGNRALWQHTEDIRNSILAAAQAILNHFVTGLIQVGGYSIEHLRLLGGQVAFPGRSRANIWIDCDGNPKFADFGGSVSVMDQGSMVRWGTPGYCAPENMNG